jgi:hypothetical protein
MGSCGAVSLQLNSLPGTYCKYVSCRRPGFVVVVQCQYQDLSETAPSWFPCRYSMHACIVASFKCLRYLAHRSPILSEERQLYLNHPLSSVPRCYEALALERSQTSCKRGNVRIDICTYLLQCE